MMKPHTCTHTRPCVHIRAIRMFSRGEVVLVFIDDGRHIKPYEYAHSPVCAHTCHPQADRMLSRGEVALMFIDDGRLVERGGEAGPSPLLSTDLWQVGVVGAFSLP